MKKLSQKIKMVPKQYNKLIFKYMSINIKFTCSYLILVQRQSNLLNLKFFNAYFLFFENKFGVIKL